MLRSVHALVALLGALAVGGSTGCSAPSEQECRTACENVVRLTAQTVEQVDEAESNKVVEEAREQLEPCIQSCAKGDRDRARCLSEAQSLKQARECAPE